MGDSGFYKTILDNLHDGVYFTDRGRCITYWNRGAERITGYPAEQVVGSHCYDNLLMHVNEKGWVLCNDLCPLAETMQDGKMRQVDVFLHHRDGHRVPVSVRVAPIRDECGEIIGAVETFSNNYSKVAAFEKIDSLQKAVFLDTLTGVGNRRYSEIALQGSFNDLRVQELSFGLLFIDIDNFKGFNDCYGHNIGDHVLKIVSNTLSSNVRSYDFVGRWGGEEFIVLIANTDADGLLSIAEKLRNLVEQSHLTVGEQRLRVTISIGAALAVAEDTPEELVQRADQSMYRCKRQGGNRVCLSVQELEGAAESVSLVHD